MNDPEFVRAASRLMKGIYEDHPTGCCLHVVLDDMNCDDASIEHCRQRATESHHADCHLLATMLLEMTEDERQALLVPIDEVIRTELGCKP